jgi:O-antigen/teichoic acid export membrane protein
MPEDRQATAIPLSQRLVRNFVMLFVANVAGQVLLLFAMVHLARVVGPVAFGVWGFAQAWMMYLFRIGEMGLEVAGIRAIAIGGSESVRPTVWNVLAVRLVLAVAMIAVIAMAVALGLFPEGSGKLLMIFSIAVLPVAAILEWVFEAHQEIPVVGLSRILKGFLFGGMVLLLVRNPDQIVDAAWFYTCSLVIPSLVVFVIAIRRFSLLPPRRDRESLRKLVRAALPIGVATTLSQVTLFIGTVLAGYLVLPERLGYYAAGHRLVIFVWVYAIVSLDRVILPQLSRLFGSSHDGFVSFVNKYLRALSLLAFPIAVCGFAGGAAVIHLLYGETYAASAMVFQVLCLALGIAMIRSVFEVGLIAAHRQRLYMYGMMGLVAVYCVLTFIGLKLWDIVGAAWASVVAEFCYAVYLLIVFRYLRIREVMRVCAKPMLASAVLFAAMLVTDTHALPSVIAGGVLGYPLLLLLFGGLAQKDLDMVVRLLLGRQAES